MYHRSGLCLLTALAFLSSQAPAHAQDSALDVVRTSLSGNTTYTTGQSVQFNTVELDTVGIGGANPRQAWQDGLYHITGNLLMDAALSGGGNATGQLRVNGQVVDQFFFRANNAGEIDEIPISAYVQLQQGEQVDVTFVSTSGQIRVYGGDFSYLEIAAINNVPEPTSAVILGLSCLAILHRRR